MKLLKYLKEAIDFDSDRHMMSYEDLVENFAPKLAKECKPYITAVKKCKQDHLYRGVQTSSMYGTRKVRQDRKPKDMKLYIHNDLDLAFEEEFGWKARSASIFAIGLKSPASDYGTPCRIWPAGKFKVLWSPEIDDLYQHILDEYTRNDKDIPYEAIAKMYVEGDLCGALLSGREIMIKADKYYFVNARWLESFVDYPGFIPEEKFYDIIYGKK